MLFTRAWPRKDVQVAFDRWQLEKHLPELIQGPGITWAGYYRAVEEGLPQAYRGSGSCMACYVASTLDGLRAWLRSPVLDAAIQDGSRWFSQFNELDGDAYTGNIYEPRARLDRPAPKGTAFLFAERFEVPAESEAAFDSWLTETHLEHVEAQSGVFRARVFDAVRNEIPIDYYLSPGNRLLLVEIDADAVLEVLLAPGFQDAMRDSLAWDRQLPYLRRDVYEPIGHVQANRIGERAAH